MSCLRSRGKANVTQEELTLRGIIIGGVITLVFTAANVCPGLKVGLTFIPPSAAQINTSMAILRFWSSHVQESNIVQTIASAAGTTLRGYLRPAGPGDCVARLVEQAPTGTMFVCAVGGGALGVMYSIPARRALVTGSDLPYPEVWPALRFSGRGCEGFGRGQQARSDGDHVGRNRIGGDDVARLPRVRLGGGRGVQDWFVGTMISTSLSLALIGVGHLVGADGGVRAHRQPAICGVLLPLCTNGSLDGAEDHRRTVLHLQAMFASSAQASWRSAV